jgi:uncharacterized protein YdeI (YjbR/CyaY-like superfamily)
MGQDGLMNPKVDGYVRKVPQWRDVLAKMRGVILDCGLTEEVKWRVPCYTFQQHNVIIIGRFKEYCMLNFVKGALLKDARGILVKPGENTQAARVIRFTNVQQIVELEPVLKAYIREAVEVEKAGLKVKLKKTSDYAIPQEFKNKLNKMPALKAAFTALTPGRQRAYLLYFSSAKQSKTRETRVEKWLKHILNGKGMDD